MKATVLRIKEPPDYGLDSNNVFVFVKKNWIFSLLMVRFPQKTFSFCGMLIFSHNDLAAESAQRSIQKWEPLLTEIVTWRLKAGDTSSKQVQDQTPSAACKTDLILKKWCPQCRRLVSGGFSEMCFVILTFADSPTQIRDLTIPMTSPCRANPRSMRTPDLALKIR